MIAGRTSLPDSAILTAVFTSYLEEFYSETQKDVKTYGEGQGNCKTARWLPPVLTESRFSGSLVLTLPLQNSLLGAIKYVENPVQFIPGCQPAE